MSIVNQVAALRKRARVPATRVAEIAGTGASNVYAIEHGRRDPSASTLERIAAANGVRLIAVPTSGAALVAESVDVLRNRIDEGNITGAYRQLIQISDDLTSSSASTALLLAYAEPPAVTAEWNAAVAGIVEWRLQEQRVPLPDWLSTHGNALTDRWEPLPAPYSINASDVPEPLRRRNVWIERAELESA